MNILILGNGFDLAHHLPTKYSDFLGFAQRLLFVYTWQGNLQRYLEQHIESWNDGHEYLKEQLQKIFERSDRKKVPIENGLAPYNFVVNVDENIDTFRDRLVNNIWFNYMTTIYKDNLVRGENWIDFESEISFVIQALDRQFESLEDRFTFEQLKNDWSTVNNKLKTFCSSCEKAFRNSQKDDRLKNEWSSTIPLSLLELRNRLYDDLEALILAFEFYLTEFVHKILEETTVEKLPFVDEVNPKYVLSFNYTKTFENLYRVVIAPNDSTRHVPTICHVHGECDIAHAPNDNNMVIGIDEYWETPEEQSKRTNFAIFKKFIQRIRKANSIDYVTWAEKVDRQYRNNRNIFSSVYIFGHSLDVTDKDILEKFLSTDATYLYIYARGKASEGTLITNLLKIIGREAVMRKASAGKIKFLNA